MYNFWVTYPCERRTYVSLKSENILLNLNRKIIQFQFFTIRVNFDKIQFEDYCIYRPNSFLSLKYILFTEKRFPGDIREKLRQFEMESDRLAELFGCMGMTEPAIVQSTGKPKSKSPNKCYSVIDFVSFCLLCQRHSWRWRDRITQW